MLKHIWRWTKRIFIIGFVSSFLYLLLCKWVMPPITITQLVSFAEGYGLKRDYVSWNEISPNVKLAAIAAEDQLFPVHNGFDWNALKKSLDSDRGGTAASTISQQTAKNVFLWQGESTFMKYLRKGPEFYFTQLVEWIWGKERILEVYLNTIEMGKGIFGIEAAAQAYFGKHAKDLTRAEAAQIVACFPNPKEYAVKPLSKYVAGRSRKIMKQMYNIQDDAGVRALIAQPAKQEKQK
ncbi:monofunctional biosynthetic peptidoglycan transglycosylase [Panacibacter sp. DH6]|uniref:Monofunctional biosynthetic peptidoglycan transglycosylase n=1 Tax=Panacibacter microcysteis TaxID=2793269 RepID=A0A931E8R5_9BACT|nr:monofunctional biosynthetic peptidoglycan transglycosylase [Panacibacter microcysteis]MBG9375796.1 monofunctional biosynthetic peptidoglycan transglycosylase [Panacibacter microcysteis]